MTTGDLSTTFSIDLGPSGIDLCTLDDVRAFLQEPAADTQQDPIISQFITAASREIQRWTHREFAPRTDGASRTLLYAGGGMLDLAPYDLRAATSVVLDSDQPSPVTLAATTDYRLRPVPTPDDVYQWLQFPRGGLASHGRCEREVTITGDWGWPSVPEDVQHACIVTVALWLKRDVSAFSRTFNIDEGRTERPDALPAAVVAMLRPYRAIAVA